MSRANVRYVVSFFILVIASGGTTVPDHPGGAHAAAAVVQVAPSPPGTHPPASTPVGVTFRNVRLHVDESIVLDIPRLDGALLSRTAGRPPVFDDDSTFTLRVDSGELAMSPASLSMLMNNYVLAYPGAPLQNLEISIEDGRLKTKGTLRKGVAVPFTIVSDASVTSNGWIRLRPKSVKTTGIPTRGLMQMFGVELDDLIKLKRTPAVRVVDDDFLLDAGRLLPAPHVDGRLTAIRIEPTRIVQIFGARKVAAPPTPPDRGARNFMYYHGGVLRFGKLTMTGADMQLIDADPRDPFDVFPKRYVKQLVAGYSTNTPSGGLKVYMPDYNQADSVDLKPASSP